MVREYLGTCTGGGTNPIDILIEGSTDTFSRPQGIPDYFTGTTARISINSETGDSNTSFFDVGGRYRVQVRRLT